MKMRFKKDKGGVLVIKIIQDKVPVSFNQDMSL